MSAPRAALGDIKCTGQHDACEPGRCHCNLPWCDHLQKLTREQKWALIREKAEAPGFPVSPVKLVTEQAMTEKLQSQEDRYHYAVEVFVQDGDGYISAGEVAWSMTRSGAEQMAQEMLDKRWVPSKRPLSGDWVKFVVTESREVSVARFCYRAVGS